MGLPQLAFIMKNRQRWRRAGKEVRDAGQRGEEGKWTQTGSRGDE